MVLKSANLNSYRVIIFLEEGNICADTREKTINTSCDYIMVGFGLEYPIV